MFSSPWNFLLTCLTTWIHHEQQQRLRYLQLEMTIAKELLGTKRLRYTNGQRCRLAVNAKTCRKKMTLENRLPRTARWTAQYYHLTLPDADLTIKVRDQLRTLLR